MTTGSPAPTAGGSAATPAASIEVTNLSRWYGNVVAVNDITFSIGPGITGLLGPNGAGKSTILHVLSGLLKPSAGAVSVLGLATWRQPELYRSLGLVPEREAVYSFLSGYEFVRMSARLHDLPAPDVAARRALAAVELEDAMDRPAGEYSKGMRQRLKVAAAIVHEPLVLLLDEPFNGADPRQRLRMIDLFQRMAAAGTTIVFSSHILEEVERLAENVLVIVAGRLAASGDFHEVRRLMTDRPHSFTLRSSDNRRLGAALLSEPTVLAVEVDGDGLNVRTADFGAFCLVIPGIAARTQVSLFELRPTDESLESVFSYLVRR
jgi:ABC-2 type transport system ATP-binding protein